MSKYGVISGPYFPVFGLKAGKYGPKITPYFDSFHADACSKITNTESVFAYSKSIMEISERYLKFVQSQH